MSDVYNYLYVRFSLVKKSITISVVPSTRCDSSMMAVISFSVIPTSPLQHIGHLRRLAMT